MSERKRLTAEECQQGLRVVWLHVPRGGYGFVVHVPATVQKVTGVRVAIRLDATERLVYVTPERLEREGQKGETQ